MKVARAYHHVRIGVLLEGLVYLFDDVGSVCEVCIGKHHYVALCRQHRGSHRITLSHILLISDDADTWQIHLPYHVTATVTRAVVGKNYFVIVKVF